MAKTCLTVVRIEPDDFDVGKEMSALYDRSGGNLGAVASFTGLVRDRAGDAEVTALRLEHYPGMTERSIEKIVAEAGTRWPLLDVVVIHRVGELAAREQIVYVQVAATHRDAAFAGAEFIMDYLKTDAVLWKRESGTTADRWIEATVGDRKRRESWGPGSESESESESDPI